MSRLAAIFPYLLAAVFAVVVGPAPSFAQTAAAPPITADQARTALDMLNDPAKRAAFAATLNAIAKAPQASNPAAASAAGKADAAKPAAAEPAPEAPIIPLAPDSLGAQVLASASDFTNRLGTQAMQAIEAVQSVPLLYNWLFVMATNPAAQDMLGDVSWRLAIAMAGAAAIEYGLRRLLRGPIHSLHAIAPPHPEAEEIDPEAGQAADGTAAAEPAEADPPARAPKPSAWILLRRVPVVVARLVLELIPVAGLIVVGHLVAGSILGGNTISRLIILAVIDSYAICMAILSVARMLLSPNEPRLRLFHLRDQTALYMMRWMRRLVVLAVFGYAIGEVGLLLGLSDVAHDLLEKSIGLVLHVSLAVIVLEKRRPVRRALRAPEGQTGFMASVRNRMAASWYWIALFLLASSWLVWAVEIPHGFTALVHYFIITSLVLIGARLTSLALLGAIDRLMSTDPDATTIGSGIDGRLHIYHSALAGLARVTIYLLCSLGLLQLYGMNTFIWLITSTLGQRILSALGTVTLTIVLSFVVWETVNASVHAHLDRLQREAQVARSARLRTLLPLLRTALLIGIAIVAGLTILSEIGINISPLLAGAGIVGVAIGFGSQKLVQDLITGIFLLLENAMQVGDYVTVSGLSGTVEALSVRAIRLRAADGSVHLIPFSAVTSVTNVNRGLGNASVHVVVDFDEDTDRVSDELKAIVAEMRDDPTLSAMMLSDLQLWGVDQVNGASVTIAGQVVCTDSGRWAVQREFNRRMKRRFQAAGIKIYNASPTIAISAVMPPSDPMARAVGRPADQGDVHGQAQAAN